MSTYNLARIGLMSSFVLVTTFLKVTIFHFGNAACLLSGLLLGPTQGALAAAIGSFIFDILNPVYIASAPFTFVFKFIMVFVCGKIAYAHDRNGEDRYYNLCGAILGSLLYIILRATKALILNLVFLKMEQTTALLIVSKGIIVSLMNSTIAVVASVLLVSMIKSKMRFWEL